MLILSIQHAFCEQLCDWDPPRPCKGNLNKFFAFLQIALDFFDEMYALISGKSHLLYHNNEL